MAKSELDEPNGSTLGEECAENELTSAVGNIITVDRTLFFHLIKYLAECKALEEFEDYLEKNDCYELLLDVTFANHLKRFLLQTRRTHPTAKLAIRCSCGGGGGGGGGGGSPSGVRG